MLTDSRTESPEHTLIISEGQYLDDDRINKDYGKILLSLTCSTGTGTLIHL